MFSSTAKSSLLIYFSFVLLSVTLVSSSSPPAGAPTSCFLLDGTKNKFREGFRCNNGTTGHSSCCSPGAICFSNGVCQQANGAVQDFLRVGCTDPTWNDPACLKQCAPFGVDTAGIRFCNGAITSTTSYCCDNGTMGVGSFACCNTPSDIFNIAPVATVLAQMPLSQVSLPTSTSSMASSSATATTTASAEMNFQKTSSDNVNGGAIAAGILIPILIIGLIVAGFYYHRHRTNAKNQQQSIHLSNVPRRSFSPGPRKAPGPYYDTNSPIVYEANSDTSSLDKDTKKKYMGDDEIDALTDKDIEAGLQRPTKVFEMA